MRTTLTIDDDVLAAAKGLAAREHKSVGQVISSLVRQALQSFANISPQQRNTRNGVPLLPVRDALISITPELVNRLRDELD